MGYNTPSLSALAGVVTGGVLSDLTEFEVSIKVAGNGRLWTNTPLPTADLFGTNGYPTFVGTQGIFEKLDHIQITAIVKTDLGNPDAIISNVQNRKLRICFHGYQILNPITLCDVLGY